MPGSVASPRLRLADHVSAEVSPEAAFEPVSAEDPQSYWLQSFRSVRAETERRAAFLSSEDQVVQSMPDASPTKWHRAHTTWFFEQFLLKSFAADYREFDGRFAFLFNSYYVAAGPRHARPERGLYVSVRPGRRRVAGRNRDLGGRAKPDGPMWTRVSAGRATVADGSPAAAAS